MLLAPARPRTFGSFRTFTSHRENDTESVLMHYRARSYDPRTGRFIQKDAPGRLKTERHEYSYAANEPIQSGDPLGRAVWDLSLIRNVADRPDRRRSYDWWKRVSEAGGALDSLMRRLIDELPGTAIWPREFAQIRGEVLHHRPEWSRESRASLYKTVYDTTTIRVGGNTIQLENGVVAQVSNLLSPAGSEIAISGASWPGGDDDDTAVKAAAFILIHELVHVIQKQGYEPLVELSGHFSATEMVERGKLFGVGWSQFVDNGGSPAINAPFEPFAYFLQGRATAGNVQEAVKKSTVIPWSGVAATARGYGVGLGGNNVFAWEYARWPEQTLLHTGHKRYLKPPAELLSRIRF